ncbi:cilia- and flagella-associated protein 418 isoform X1 [Amia ocellicauda]|uniref:cilia- and flagella-associated protein 418 isoform X1 n=1 Tax=Amia ocellicauda TaxID=2972642 RepID=UPI0034641E4B
MAEDLDALLDEAERRFCSGASSAASRGPGDSGAAVKPGERRKKQRTSPKRYEDEDIDDLIEDLFEDEFEPLKVRNKPGGTNSDVSNSPSCLTSRKCCPVFLGGSSVPSGVGTSISQRACSRLRCTSCDFRLATFDDHEWDPSCDYLFFRNNMPDCQKLKAKLLRKRGTRAYACQCSWRSVHSLTDLRREQELKWVCGKHET